MSDTDESEIRESGQLLTLTTDIVVAYASRNQMSRDGLPELIQTVHAALAGLGGDTVVPADLPAAETAPAVPAVPIDASVKKDAIICLECGKSFKTLKRHLSTEHGLTPAEYKAKWQLSKDYPLVAPSYSKRRAATAKKIGLGRKTAGG